MKIIVCVDDNNGLMFNERRISRDAAVIDRIIKIVGNAKLFVSGYSAPLFTDFNVNLVIDDSFLKNARAEDYCFIENKYVNDYLAEIKKVVLYRWNRKYPSDFKFPTENAIQNKRCIAKTEFEGNSHEKITEEIYI